MSLVSKRFRALCLAPQLIREVSLSLYHKHDVHATLRSLNHWLAFNAQHVHDMHLDITLPADRAVDSGLVVGCLATCCTAAPLKKLALSFRTQENPPTLAWLMTVRCTLADLYLSLSNAVTIDTPLQQCTALTDLTLDCRDLEFSPGCRLPSSLTSLTLQSLQGLPNQASTPTGCRTNIDLPEC